MPALMKQKARRVSAGLSVCSIFSSVVLTVGSQIIERNISNATTTEPEHVWDGRLFNCITYAEISSTYWLSSRSSLPAQFYLSHQIF
jgi:hypothetical protein